MHDYAVCHRVLTSCTDRNDVVDRAVSSVQVMLIHVNILPAAWIRTDCAISSDEVMDSEQLARLRRIPTSTCCRLLRIAGWTWLSPVGLGAGCTPSELRSFRSHAMAINTDREMTQGWMMVNAIVGLLLLVAFV